MKKIPVKTLYLLLFIGIGLAILGVGSTYAIFTTSAEISDPIALRSELTYTGDVIETIEINVLPGSTISNTLNITNSSGSILNYTAWYLDDGNDIDIVSSSGNVSGSLNNDASTSLTVDIRNNTNEDIIVILGITSDVDSIVLGNGMKTLSSGKLPSINLKDYLTNLYKYNYDSSKNVTFADDSGMNYYAPEVSLMNDGLDSTGTMTNDPYTGNIRYYGSTPDNYIYFNCSDYDNQSDTTCEKWRIVGIVDGKVKIIRESSLGRYAWDYTSDGTYDNNWTDATINTLLNTAYYNSGSMMTYYNGNTTGELSDLSSTGINEATRNAKLISSSTWYINAFDGTSKYANSLYLSERSGSNSWNGNIALLYPSDYAYATDLNKCSYVINEYSNCTSDNWLVNTLNTLLTSSEKTSSWFISSVKNVATNSWIMWLRGDAEPYGNVHGEGGVSPTLYLNSNVVIDSGDGSSNSPYQIYVKPVKIIDYITNLYTSGTPTLIKQDTTNDTYYYSYQDTNQTWGLMNDGLKVTDTYDGGVTTVTNTDILTSGTEGNIRYFGPSASVNNYIYFNCFDYNNQSDSTCEKWRIIGIVDGKVKIMRSSGLGTLAWDQRRNQNESSTSYSNKWSSSSLQEFLNGLYYNRGEIETHDYYSGSDGTSVDNLNLKNISLKNDDTRKKVSSSTWYLGGTDTAAIYPDEFYTYERTDIPETTLLSGYPLSIDRNVGLISASDYGYASNLTKCSSTINVYNSSTNSYGCRSTNWIFNGDYYHWILNIPTNYTSRAFRITTGGAVGAVATYSGGSFEAIPSLYLDLDLIIQLYGDGSFDNPYRIKA